MEAPYSSPLPASRRISDGRRRRSTISTRLKAHQIPAAEFNGSVLCGVMREERRSGASCYWIHHVP
jgi:hypothetical protein